MTQHSLNNIEMHTRNIYWTAPVRLLHWLTAASMIGAASLTSQGEMWHASLGWIALVILLILQFVYSRPHTPNPALWLITAAVAVLNLSGWLMPYGTIHFAATLVGLVFAAFYCATVLFESLQIIISVWIRIIASIIDSSQKHSSVIEHFNS
jgi:hypothetical protein